MSKQNKKVSQEQRQLNKTESLTNLFMSNDKK